MVEKFLLRVAESSVLTGLGVLLVPTAPAPPLADLALHTTLPVTLRYPDGRQESAAASVEELTHADRPTVRALLLALANAAVPAGTEVWWNGEAADW